MLTRAWNQCARQKGTSRNHGPQSRNHMKFGRLKRNSLLSNNCHFSMRYPLENGEFPHLGPKNCDFAIYSNFCFLTNFLLKNQNGVLLVLGWLLKLIVYDFAFKVAFKAHSLGQHSGLILFLVAHALFVLHCKCYSFFSLSLSWFR